MIITKTATIKAGQTLSDAISLGRCNINGLEVPELGTAAVVYLRVARDEGAPYRRLLKTDGSGDWNIASSTGDRMIFIDEAAPFLFFKVELGTAQAADVQFTFVQVTPL